MKTLNESVVTSLDGNDIELLQYLPYILQDIWETGASPEIIIELVKKQTRQYSSLKVLDLGCGKGAVSIKLANKLRCSCYGIDAVKEFVDEAILKARECRVNSICKFEAGDIRIKVKELPDFDIIILGAIGPVFGDYYSTLTTLSKCLNKDGIIIIDDGYIEDSSSYSHPLVLKKEAILEQIKKAGMKIIDEVIIREDEMKKSNDYIFENLKRRCIELIKKYPDKKMLFENYIKKQEEENDVLETKIVCSTMVIRK